MVNNSALDIALSNANLISENSSLHYNLTHDYEIDSSNTPIDSCSSVSSSQNKSKMVSYKYKFLRSDD